MGNVYLHYVLDLWFETEVKPRLRGKATLIRYADDFVIGFEREDDARRVLAVLGQAAGALRTDPAPGQDPPAALSASADRRNRAGKVRPPSTFWGSRSIGGEPATGRLGDGVQDSAGAPETGQYRPSTTGVDAIGTSRSRRSTPRSVRRLRGHFNYFGVSGNFRSLLRLVEATKRAWYKWLCRRSQRKRLTWERFDGSAPTACLSRVPRITVRIWGA